jgi:hypothetical protein
LWPFGRIDVPVLVDRNGEPAGRKMADGEGAVVCGDDAFVLLIVVVENDVCFPQRLALVVHDDPRQSSVLFLCANGTDEEEQQDQPLHYKS